MTSKCALVKALLEGRVLNVKNCFREIGLTNIAREIPRLVEKPFCVEVSRTPREGKNRYNQPVSWTDYRLNSSDHNLEGIRKMKEFIEQESKKDQAIRGLKTAQLELQTNKLF